MQGMRADDVYTLPPGLPVPEDDGACRHLPGLRLPPLSLASTRGDRIDLASLGGQGRAVVYVYPRTGRPDEPLLPGWDEIPGARGCTPQACAFRDHHAALRALGAEVYGLSVQSSEAQREFAGRVQLPCALLSDAGLTLTSALRLPTFETSGLTLLRRFTLIVRGGVIEHVFYPVFPPDRNAAEVVRWLEAKR